MRWLLSLMCICFVAAATGEETFVPLQAKRILVLGDSNTFAGHYVDVLDATLRDNGHSIEIINLGLPSETCSGLTEPDHPFPRPDVHERINRALAKIHPDVVVACYGMNDGIYHPFSEERFASYQRGINEIIEKVHASGAKLVLMTPPPFDPLPLVGKPGLVSADAKEFGWKSVFEGYDDVMKRYADWVLQQSDRVEMVVDVRSPVLMYLEARRTIEPQFSMSPDGVHLNDEGHTLIADAILDAWGLSDRTIADDALLKQVAAQQAIMKLAWLSEVGHKRPGVTAGLPIVEARQKATELAP